MLENMFYMENHQLIEPADLNKHDGIETMYFKYRITPKGKFHLEKLSTSLIYLEDMLKVTPILQDKYSFSLDNNDKKLMNIKNFQN